MRPSIRSHRLIVLISALAALTISVCAAPAATAANGSEVIADCYKHLALTRTSLIVVLVVLVLAAAALGVLAVRRRRGR